VFFDLRKPLGGYIDSQQRVNHHAVDVDVHVFQRFEVVRLARLVVLPLFVSL
jgi:hypothetical protein